MESSELPPWWEPPVRRWRLPWLAAGAAIIVVALAIVIAGVVVVRQGFRAQDRSASAVARCELIESSKGTIPDDQREECDDAFSAGRGQTLGGTAVTAVGVFLAVGGAVVVNRGAPWAL